MEFKKYSSIENTYRIEVMNRIEEQGLSSSDIEWVATEKIHGANTALWYDGNEFKFSKRSGFVHHGDSSFYNCWHCIERLIPKVKVLWENFKKEHNDLVGITVCGELCGGNYPHKDVDQHQEQMIQKGIWYSPRQEFFAFGDIFLVREYDSVLIDHDSAVFNLMDAGFMITPTLHRGTLKSCLDFGDTFDSYIPTMLGLPEIEDKDGNIAEGTVIKPVKPYFFGNGSRVILKNKNEKWVEKAKKKKKVWKPKEPLTPEVQAHLDELLLYVVENRLKNVLSKIGNITNKDFGKIQGLFAKDAIEDFLKEDDGSYAILDKVDRKRIQKELSKQCALLVRENFVNILDNNF